MNVQPKPLEWRTIPGGTAEIAEGFEGRSYIVSDRHIHFSHGGVTSVKSMMHAKQQAQVMNDQLICEAFAQLLASADITDSGDNQ